jgi:hypothetical protein
MPPLWFLLRSVRRSWSPVVSELKERLIVENQVQHVLVLAYLERTVFKPPDSLFDVWFLLDDADDLRVFGVLQSKNISFSHSFSLCRKKAVNEIYVIRKLSIDDWIEIKAFFMGANTTRWVIPFSGFHRFVKTKKYPVLLGKE